MFLRLFLALLLVPAVFFETGLAQQSKKKPTVPGSTPPEDPLPRVLFFSGVAIMEDGSSLPDGLRVELNCHGNINRQSPIDQNGRFHFSLGRNQPQTLMDATVSGSAGFNRGIAPEMRDQHSGGFLAAGTGRVDLSGCSVRLSPGSGFYSNAIEIGRRSLLDGPDIGQLLLRRMSTERGNLVSLRTLTAPKRARKAFQRAQEELSKEKINYERVEQHLEKAVRDYSGFSAAWNLLGMSRLVQKNIEGARQAFQEAIAQEPNFISPYLNLVSLELERENLEEALRLTKLLIELDPSLPKSLYFHGLATFHTDQFEDAEVSFAKLRAQGRAIEAFPWSYWFLGVIHAQQGRVREAASEFHSFLDLVPEPRVSSDVRQAVQQQLADWRDRGLLESGNEGPGQQTPDRLVPTVQPR